MIPRRPAARRSSRRPAARAAEVMEPRLLLAAAGVRVVTSAENGMAVTVDSEEFSLVEVREDADIGTLTIQGSECVIEVVIRGSASSLNMQGGAAAEIVTIADGGRVGTVTFQGGGGNDFLVNRGTIDGSATLNGDAGDDIFQVSGDGEIVGGVSGSGGAGDDRFEVVGSGVIDNFSFDFGEGADTFTLSSSEATTGNFDLLAGAGDDSATFAAGTGIGGNQKVDLGAGDDEFVSDGLTVEGNQSVDLGESGPDGDSLTFGADVIEGGSSVNWAGDVDIKTTDAREVASDYTFKGVGGGESEADLDAGTTVGGNFSWTTDGVTDLTAGLTVTEGNATINTGTGTGTGADEVTLADRFAVGGNLTVTLGGDEAVSDRLRLRGDVRVGDPDEEINGNMTVALGGGDDIYGADRLVVNGNQTLNLGASGTEEDGELGGKNSVRFAEATVNGGVTVNWAGGLDARETGTRDIASDLTFNGSQGDGGNVKVFVDEGSTVGGNFTLTSPTQTLLEMGLTVEEGNATIQTGTGAGSGADTLRVLDGTSVGGNFNATLGGSESARDVIEFGDVSVGDPETGINGNMSLAVGGGADEITFDSLLLNGNQNLSLGDSGTGEDVLEFGDDRVEGGSNVTWAGDVDIEETAAREIASDYSFSGSDGEAVAMLDQGSTVDGNFGWTSAGPTELVTGLTVNQGNYTVNTGSGRGSGADTLRVLDGTSVGGNFTAKLGGGEDVEDVIEFGDVSVGDPEAGVNGNMSLTVGGGADEITFDALTLNGNQTISLGDSGDGEDLLRFGDDRIEGGSNVSWAGDADVRETAARETAADYSFNGSDGEAIGLLDEGSVVDGNFAWMSAGPTTLALALTVNQGNLNVNTGSGAGSGADNVVVRDGTRVGGNVSFALGGGESDDDVLRLLGETFVGDPETGVNGNFKATLGGGDDAFRAENLTVNGNQSVDLGDSADGEDTLRFGSGRVEGGSTVSWAGDADVRETAARDVAADYSFQGSGGAARGVVDFGSTVGGNFSWRSAGATDLELGLTVNAGNLTVGTGSGAGTGADEVTVRGGTRVGGNAKFALGGGEDDADKLRLLDEVFVGDVEENVNGNFTATLGGGSDVFVSDALTVNGNQTVDLGSGGGEGRDVARFGADVIEGSSSVDWSADARIVEREARDIAGSYLLSGGNRDARVELLDTTLTNSGNLSVTNGGRLRLTSAVQVMGGNASVDGGGDGEIDLSGSFTDGNLSVKTGDGDDELTLGDAEIAGNLSVSMEAGDDDVENAAVIVDGTETYRGGPGFDTIARREGAEVSGFEN